MTKARDEIASGLSRRDDEQTASGGVSLDVLCRRAERLINSVRMMGEQVDGLFSRPDRFVAEANATARTLAELSDAMDAKIEEARRAEETCYRHIEEFHKSAPLIQQTAEALVQRVMRARELSDAFGKLIETGGEKLAAVESAADEARKAREAIATATRELIRIQKTADLWADSVRRLNERQAEFISTGNAAASRLRTLSDAGERLRESVREDIVTLRELLRESRLERLAWEQLLARMPANLPTAAGNASTTGGKSVPASLADRVRRLTDFIRQATETGEAAAKPAEARRASGRLKTVIRSK